MRRRAVPKEDEMYLGLRDLRVARARFALVGATIALVALLSTVLSGLANGLVDDGISGLRALPITHLTFREGEDSSFSRSTLTPDQLAVFESAPGVECTPVGVAFLNATSDDGGTTVDIALFGIEPDGFLAEDTAVDDRIEGGLLLDEELADEVDVGQTLTIPGANASMPVVGFVPAGTYGHVPMAFTSLDEWQRIQYGDDARGRVSALALRVDDGVDLDALDRTAGTETGTREDAFAGSPGYSAETATMTLIRGFLLVVSALVVGAFFTVWTVQRTRQIGLLKAMGASTAYVLRDALGQLAVVLLGAVVVGTALGLAAGALVDDEAPFHFTVRSVATSAVALLLTGLAGGLTAVRRIASVDPAISLAAEQ